MRRIARRRGLVPLAGLAVVAAVIVGGSGTTSKATAHGQTSIGSKVTALVRTLAVLRRVQTAADRRADVFGDSTRYGLRTVKPLQRLARKDRWGDHIFLVPLVKAWAHGLPLNPSRGGLGFGVPPRVGASCCYTAAQIDAGGMFISPPHPWRLIMIVPDGVAAIAVRQTVMSGHHRPALVRGAVHDNVAVVPVAHNVEVHAGTQVAWYDRSGRQIKLVRP